MRVPFPKLLKLSILLFRTIESSSSTMIIRDVWPRFSRKGLVVPFIIFSIALVTLFSASENGEKYNSEIVYQCQNKTDTFISSLCNCHKSYTIDSQVLDEFRSNFHWCSEESYIRGNHQRVISYALFGDARNKSIFGRYYSFMQNISLTAAKKYPGWIIRIYHDTDENDSSNVLCDLYCSFSHIDLCNVRRLWERIGNSSNPISPVWLRGLNRRMYRNLVLLDPQVDVFISRDVDSLIWNREVDAVAEWLQSNYTFHLMRDYPLHKSPILAGMWGAKLYQRRDMIESIARAMILAGQDQAKPTDQIVLKTILWPTAKYDVMAHDSYGCDNKYILETSVVKVFPYPTQRDGKYFVGGPGGVLFPQKCPVACRPPDHQDWEYC